MLKASVLEKLRARTDWPDSLLERLKNVDGLVAEVEKYLVPVIGGQIEDDPPKQLGSSKVGGVPDVPDGFAWPSEDGEDSPLAFICQINLAELPADSGLPNSGMLYLFSIADGDRANGYEIDDATAKVIYTTDTKLSPATPPDAIEAAVDERALVFGHSLIPEERYEGHPVKKRFDYSIEKALDAAIDASGGKAVGSIRVLGNPHFFRREMRQAIDLEKHTLLLKLSGYSVSEEAFGEGDFHIVIDRAALGRGDLGAASVVFEPGT